MKTRMRKISAMMMVCLLTALLSASGAETVLQLFGDRVMKFEIENGVCSYVDDFANNTNYYGGLKNGFKGIASDGRSVFIGENTGDTRILEFDTQGNYRRMLVNISGGAEHMAISYDGNWVYANLNSWSTNAAVYRYSAVTGDGGLFIPNTGTNELGATLWELNTPRGVTSDSNGVVWVSERSNGTVYKFSADDGSYIGKVTGMDRPQAMYYNDEDNKVYVVSMNSTDTYVIDAATDVRVTHIISNSGNRLGITRAEGTLISSNYDDKEIFSYDFNALSKTTLTSGFYTNPRELITIPSEPLRPKIGELLVSETDSNRIMRISFDSGSAYDVEEEYFAGSEGVTYNGTSLRQPRGLAAFGDYVYVAEGVAGGRILKFSKWGTFKSVALDFSQTAYSDCVPAALAVTPDGTDLYVTDVRTLYIENNGNAESNYMPQGYLTTNDYGRTVYKVNPSTHNVSVFVDENNVPVGNELVEPRGVAVDSDGNVYLTSWYNDPDALYNASGRIYYYNSSGVMQAVISTGNPSSCYFDPVCVYNPPSSQTINPGPGIVTTGFGIQDTFWSPAGTTMSTRNKISDDNYWHTYIDVEVIDEVIWYTDPVFGRIMRRDGYLRSGTIILSDLGAPTYLTFANVSGVEPSPQGTVILMQ